MFRSETTPNCARLLLLCAVGSILADRAQAHASQQALVLLLPTGIYIAAGVSAVTLTVLLLAVLPSRATPAVFAPTLMTARTRRRWRPATSLTASGLLWLLVWIGLTGDHDPTANPLPLFVWTVFWIGLVGVQALIGDVWSYLNPWTGPLWLIRRAFRPWDYVRLPSRLGYSLGILAFLAFAYLLLADPAPADPSRLAQFVTAYWLFNLVMGLIFGPRWMQRAEGFALLFRTYARLAMLGRHGGKLCLGAPGWQIVAKCPLPMGLSVLAIILLGTGSFDGLNETFWWFNLKGINPLEYPGRSAVIRQTATGLIALNIGLFAAVALCVWTGLRLANACLSLARGLRLFAPTILPIALAYHVAHYLPSFLVEGQYVLVALSDPFQTGADWLGLGPHFVSTGFFNTRATVQLIFLTQAGAVVAGHMLAVLLAHAVAVRHFGTSRRAALSQAPLAMFMIAYTLFGLWLLASPRI